MRRTAAGWIVVSLLAQLGASALGLPLSADSVGAFPGQSDVGGVTTPGTAGYDAAADRYTLTSAGANTWYHVDAFHYLWIKTSGDWTLTAEISFPPPAYRHEPNPHRKGILMFRQSLDAGSAYAAFAVHGSGLTALQYRQERGANTQDVEINIDLPKTVRIEKRGDLFTTFLSLHGEPLHAVGASTQLRLQSPFYVGLGALSHDVNTTDTVQFAHVSLRRPDVANSRHPVLYSTLQTLQIEDQFRRATVIRNVPGFMQSANWAAGGKTLYVDEGGHLERIAILDPPAEAVPQPIAVGKLVDCSGNYGISPDGKWLAVSCRESPQGLHQIYLLPADGGDAVRTLTHGAQSSFFHAWSADSWTIAFTRGSASKADIFTIAAAGGAESRLTRDALNDGPDFSPDAAYIYFDSSRSGTTQIWRMHVDGSQPEQITDDEYQNSSPHVSPDGRHLAFLSQPANAGSGIGDAALKIIAFDDGLIRTLVNFQGDRGSFAMYCWGDLNHLAFISYQRQPEGD
jgi:TolB protein